MQAKYYYSIMGDKWGQNFSEYVLLIVAFTAALFAMQTYVRRGVQGKLRDIMVNSNFVDAPHPIRDDAAGVNMYVNTVSNVEQSGTTNFVWANGKFKYIEESETITDEKEK